MKQRLFGLIFRYRITLKYLIAGGTAAGTQLVVLFTLTDLFGFWYVFSAVVAFAIAVLISFTLQKFWTFRDCNREVVHQQLFLYVLLQLVILVLNTLLIYILVDVLGLWYLFAQFLLSGLVAIATFFIYKLKIFVHSDYLREIIPEMLYEEK